MAREQKDVFKTVNCQMTYKIRSEHSLLARTTLEKNGVVLGCASLSVVSIHFGELSIALLVLAISYFKVKSQMQRGIDALNKHINSPRQI